MIKEINRINSSKTNFNSKQNKIQFILNDNESNQLLNIIKNIGTIYEKPLSEIITQEDFDKINKWIGGNNDFILKYNAKKDGCNTELFHQKCDGINRYVIVCKATGKDIIGGYISTKIQKKNEFTDDNKAFLFNLTQNIIKKNNKSYQNAIKNYNDSSYFIRFGEGCNTFTLSGNCLNDTKSTAAVCTCDTNFDCSPYNLFNRTSTEYFQVDNFEVFQVV
jgi:hypothetical protein